MTQNKLARGVAIVGAGMSKFGAFPDKSSRDLFVEAFQELKTSVDKEFSPKDIVRAYQKRGTMENYIKEAKNGFKLDQMNSHSFQVNEVRMMLSLLAYNLTNWLRILAFPPEQKNMQIDTI